MFFLGNKIYLPYLTDPSSRGIKECLLHIWTTLWFSKTIQKIVQFAMRGIFNGGIFNDIYSGSQILRDLKYSISSPKAVLSVSCVGQSVPLGILYTAQKRRIPLRLSLFNIKNRQLLAVLFKLPKNTARLHFCSM